MRGLLSLGGVPVIQEGEAAVLFIHFTSCDEKNASICSFLILESPHERVARGPRMSPLSEEICYFTTLNFSSLLLCL
jgi:hypothetical protein